MKKLFKQCTIGVFIFLMLIGVVALKPPQKAHAYWYDNGIDFYNAYGVNNQMVYSTNYFYFGGRAKLADDATNTTKYRTVGYKLKTAC